MYDMLAMHVCMYMYMSAAQPLPPRPPARAMVGPKARPAARDKHACMHACICYVCTYVCMICYVRTYVCMYVMIEIAVNDIGGVIYYVQ